jgi:hypothetical protein
MHAGTRQIGYARVSTDEQGTDPQRDELAAAGCAVILEEHASGADPATTARPDDFASTFALNPTADRDPGYFYRDLGYFIAN